MILPPPRLTRTDPLSPYTPLSRSARQWLCAAADAVADVCPRQAGGDRFHRAGDVRTLWLTRSAGASGCVTKPNCGAPPLRYARRSVLTLRRIGGASCRERVCQYWEFSVGAVSLTQKNMNKEK